MNVLIVDDSAIMRAMILRTLRLSGLPLADVHQAGDGLAALEILAAHPIDLTLLDLSMPGMRGDELLEHIRRAPATRSLPVLVVSSEQASARPEQIRALGAEFLAKPFTPEALGAAVRRLTGAGDAPYTGAGVGTGAVGSGELDF
jgi:two-component system chemotaxis response regulator CheY